MLSPINASLTIVSTTGAIIVALPAVRRLLMSCSTILGHSATLKAKPSAAKENHAHYYLSQEFLELTWHDMIYSTRGDELFIFRGMFIMISAKNFKLEAKSSTF
jgi:hypothetical protein